MSRDSSIEYHSKERRNAIRVIPTGCKLQFKHSDMSYACRDISVQGVGLEYDPLLPFAAGEIVAFVLNQNDQVIGKIKARLVHQALEQHSGWQFTAVEDSVKEFIDELVLATQKDYLKKAAQQRRKAYEQAILDKEDLPLNS